MSSADRPDESGRLAALYRYQLSETTADAGLAAITELVRLTLDVPMAAVVLVDRDRHSFKATQGFEHAALPRELSFCSSAIQQTAPLAIADALADRRYAGDPMVLNAPFVRSFVGAPLLTPDGYAIGVLCGFDRKARHFSAAHRAILDKLGRVVLDQLDLRQIANSDPLTGVLSRGGLTMQVERDMVRARRYERPSTLVLFDIDNFTRINDRLGQEAGDEVLRRVADRCRGSLRQTDALGRMGGDEFAVLLPETADDEAMQCADRLRQSLEGMIIPGSGDIPVTASFGVAALSPSIVTVSQWFAESDIALYEAKTYGRNRCVLARPERFGHVAPPSSGARPQRNLH